MSADALRPTPLEIASGLVVGEAPGAAALPRPERGVTALTALERAVLPALARPPCLVSFSGGRDSSAVLAVATRVARREGLPLPVPTTLRFPQASDSEESEWQELVVRHLDLDEWHRLEFIEELDAVGPIARAVLRRHGLLWPPNTYVHQPMLEDARGGSLLTGIEGDGLLGGWRWRRAVDVVARRCRPEPKDALRLAYAALPKVAKGAIERRRTDAIPGWLRPEARRAAINAWAEEQSSEPVRWDRRLEWWARRRYLAVMQHCFGLLAADCEVQLVHPLLDRHFLATLASAGGPLGFGDRTATMRAIFAGVLPDELLARPRKAGFTQALWGAPARAFVESWDGSGVDHELVDEASLRAAWAQEGHDFRAATLLQAALLAAGREVGEPVHDSR